MDKMEAQNVLMQFQPGTFLVRFSDSEAGGVSVTWVAGMCILYLVCHCIIIAIENDAGENQTYRLAPWGKHDLSIRNFADR